MTGFAERLGAIPVAVMCDTLVAAGLPCGVVSSRFRPLQAFSALAGPALCFSGHETTSADDLIYETDRAVMPGAVVVVASANRCRGALLGGNMVTSWRQRGCAGLLVDGFIRDSADFMGLPTLTTCGVTPMPARRMWRYRSLTEPVTLPGQVSPVLVGPGDWVHADVDGCLILPGEYLSDLIELAEGVRKVEARIRDQILQGLDREIAYRGNDRYAHVPDLPRKSAGRPE
ncbi:MAG: RraA family protein [Pseudorhodobacter sp.]